MPNTTVGPIDKAEELTRARRKLDYACSYLRAFQAENQKQIAKESRDIEAFLSGCITACASIYYTLTRTDAPASSWIAEAKQWKASLDIGDREFLNRMFSSRGDDFHRCAFVVDFQLRWVSAHGVPNVQVIGPPGILMRNPDPNGTPAYAPAFVGVYSVGLDGGDAEATCTRLIRLLKALIDYYNGPK